MYNETMATTLSPDPDKLPFSLTNTKQRVNPMSSL
jgi:hypothetical protein